MTYLEQNAATGRHVFPDLVRAFALLGIVLVNVAYFAYPGEITYGYGGIRNGADVAASFAVDALFLFKSYTLFSVMFGAGLAYQMMSAERRGVTFGPRYFRRLFGLLLLGVLHVTFAFVGDILILYAVLGAVLYLFRNRSERALKRWAFGLLTLQIVLSVLGAVGFAMGEHFDPDAMAASDEAMRATMAVGADIYANGSFAQIVAQRWNDWVGYVGFAVIGQAPGALSFFLFGLLGVRSGALQDPDAPLWSKARRLYLPMGLLLSAIGAWLIVSAESSLTGQGLAGMALVVAAAPLSSIGYLGVTALWATGPMTGLKTFFARAGTSSLTAYLLQSLILSFIFHGYGLGLYARIGAAGCVAIALVTGFATLAFSSLWRTRFARGPFESVLRRWTYLGKS